MAELIKMTREEWMAKGTGLFGEDKGEWAFACPVCKHVARVKDFERYDDAGATPESATYECIGRYSEDNPQAFGLDDSITQPCNYVGYGLFKLSPVRVVHPDGHEKHCFAFAEEKAVKHLTDEELAEIAYEAYCDGHDKCATWEQKVIADSHVNWIRAVRAIRERIAKGLEEVFKELKSDEANQASTGGVDTEDETGEEGNVSGK